MILLFNKNQEFINEISKEDIISAYSEEELNGLIQASITIPYKIWGGDIYYFAYKKQEQILMYKITNKKRENGLAEISGVHILFDELKNIIIRDKRPKNVTAQQAMTVVLEGTNWNVISTVQGSRSDNFYYISALDAFYKVLKNWNCEFRVEVTFNGSNLVKKLYLEKNISSDYGKWYEYGDKLVSVVAEENNTNIATAFIGRGKGIETGNGGYSRKIDFSNIVWTTASGKPVNKPKGQDYIEIASATRIYGYPNGNPRIQVIEFTDIEDENTLIEETYKYALENSRPRLQLKATAIDDKKVELGEVATVIRSDLDIRYKTRIFKIKNDLMKDVQIFEFGDKIVVSRSERIKAEKITTEEKERNNFQIIESKFESILNSITETYFGEDGYNYDLKVDNEYKLPAGLYSFNKAIDQNPTKVIYIGAGKMLIADGKKPDGTWNWKTAATGEGIAGETIISNSITANKLAADVGQALDLSSNTSITSKVSNVVKSTLNEDAEILRQKDREDIINENKNLTDEALKISSENKEKLEATDESINSIQDDLKNVNELTSELIQTSSQFNIKFSKYDTDIKNNEDRLAEIEANIRSGVDDDNNVYTEWGSSDSESTVRVSNDGIQMLSSNTPTLTLKDGVGEMTSLYVQNELGLGNHKAVKMGTTYTVFVPTGGK